MDEMEHKYFGVDGVKLHVAEIGSGSTVVVFLHGFLEIWYSWHHQMIIATKAGYRAITPDYRGYRLSDPPLEPEKTSFSVLVTDLLAILDSLHISKVFLNAKDFGCRIACLFSFLHLNKVYGIATMGAPLMPPLPSIFHTYLLEGFYISRWMEPGRAEKDFGHLDAKIVVKNIYILFSKSEIPIVGENQEIMDLVDPSTPLPPWFTEEDLAAYGDLYEKSGFQTALQVPYT